MLLNNFEQYLESFVLNTQNVKQSAGNQTIRLNTSKNELLKIVRGFRVFEYAVRQQTKTRKCRKSTQSFLNQKVPSVNALPLLQNCLKVINLLSTYHFGFNTRKSQFQASIVNAP